jgi:lipopolysaccharide cholinephosphotransferase
METGMNENHTDSLKELQAVNLAMIRLLDEICGRYGLTYYALGGTLIGAVRHQGFIPWDDDVDIGMPRPDFEQFLKVAPAALPEGYRLRTIHTSDAYRTYMVKIENTSVSFYREFYARNTVVEKPICAWIDVMPIDGMPGDRRQFYRHLKRLKTARQMISLSLLDKNMGTSKKRSRKEMLVIRAGLRTGLYRLLNPERMYARFERLCRKYSVTDAPILGNTVGIYGRREFVRREVFGTPVRRKFEDLMIACPQDTDAYLRHVYGDYMTLPPEADRHTHEIRFAKSGNPE